MWWFSCCMCCLSFHHLCSLHTSVILLCRGCWCVVVGVCPLQCFDIHLFRVIRWLLFPVLLRCIVVFDTAKFAICVFHCCSITLDACSLCFYQYTAIPLNLLGFAGFPITTSYAFVGVRMRYLEFRCTDNDPNGVFWFRFYLTICHLPFSVKLHWLYHNQVCLFRFPVELSTCFRFVSVVLATVRSLYLNFRRSLYLNFRSLYLHLRSLYLKLTFTVELLFVVLMIVPVVEVDICCDYYTCFNWYRRFFFLVCSNLLKFNQVWMFRLLHWFVDCAGRLKLILILIFGEFRLLLQFISPVLFLDLQYNSAEV